MRTRGEGGLSLTKVRILYGRLLKIQGIIGKSEVFFLAFASLLKKMGKKVGGGGLKFLAGCTQGGGGSYGCVLSTSATGGVGGSKNWEKMLT